MLLFLQFTLAAANEASALHVDSARATTSVRGIKGGNVME
jgi:hypothetical protein